MHHTFSRPQPRPDVLDWIGLLLVLALVVASGFVDAAATVLMR